MFSWLFRRPLPDIALQPVGELFSWGKGTTLTALDPLVFALPIALLGDNDVMTQVIDCDDNAYVAIPDGDDKIYIQLQPKMSVTIRRSAQAMVLGCRDDDTSPKRILMTSP